MKISINLTQVLKTKGITSKELCDYVGITEANMSILRSGKAKGIRFETLMKICDYLDCQPGDILVYEREAENEKTN